MEKCVECQGTDLREVKEPHERKFHLAGGKTLAFRFDDVPQTLCGTCGERYFDAGVGTAEENAFTRELIARQIRDPAVVKWLRKTAGLKAAELAELFGVTPETISNWERGKTFPSRAEWILLDALALDAMEGRTTTCDRLRAAEPRLPKGPVRLALKATG